MVLLAKVALGFSGTLALATVYTFRDGVVRVDVDEHKPHGAHVHVLAPAAVVPMVMHFVPDDKLDRGVEKLREWQPTLRVLMKELKKYPDTKFVEVRDGKDHVQVSVRNGKVVVDVSEPETTVHVACPLAMIEDVTSELASRTPGV
jgi:hypothetical protein